MAERGDPQQLSALFLGARAGKLRGLVWRERTFGCIGSEPPDAPHGMHAGRRDTAKASASLLGKRALACNAMGAALGGERAAGGAASRTAPFGAALGRADAQGAPAPAHAADERAHLEEGSEGVG
jgi:hypothetical protein